MSEKKEERKRDRHSKENLKLNHELENPCMKEHYMSLKCLDDNNYKRESCELYFTNYRNCRKFWSYVVSQRKLRGIKPYLPVPEDREAVKQEYLPMYTS